MSIINNEVGKSIAYLRQNAGMTQQQLAATLNVSHQAVSKWENGAALPDIGTLISLSRLFGVTMEQMLTGNIPGMPDETANNDPFQSIQSFAEKAAKAAQQFGENVAHTFNKALGNDDSCDSNAFYEDDGCEISIECDDEETETTSKGMSLKSLIDLAPFISKEKLNEELEKCDEIPTAEQLKALAPYVSSETLEMLLRKYPDSIDASVLIKLAPFMKKDQLFRILSDNAGSLNLSRLRSFAPFLKRNMVDSLLETVNRAKETVQSEEFKKQANDTLDSIKEKVESAFKAVIADDEPESEDTEEEKVTKEPVEVKVVSSDLRDKVARAALAAGSWKWLESHIESVGDEQLIYDIAVKSSESEERSTVFSKSAALLSNDKIAELAAVLISNRNYSFMKLLPAQTAGSEMINSLIVSACEEANSNPDALKTLKQLLPFASKETLTHIVDEAIKQNDWILIETLTPFI